MISDVNHDTPGSTRMRQEPIGRLLQLHAPNRMTHMILRIPSTCADGVLLCLQALSHAAKEHSTAGASGAEDNARAQQKSSGLPQEDLPFTGTGRRTELDTEQRNEAGAPAEANTVQARIVPYNLSMQGQARVAPKPSGLPQQEGMPEGWITYPTESSSGNKTSLSKSAASASQEALVESAYKEVIHSHVFIRSCSM